MGATCPQVSCTICLPRAVCTRMRPLVLSRASASGDAAQILLPLRDNKRSHPNENRCNVRLFWGLRGHEPVEVKSGASELEIEKDGHGMREHFANKAMLKMPQIMHPKAGHGKALRQMRAHGFHSLTQAGASLQQGETMGRGHPFAGSGHHKDTVAFR